MLSKGYNCRNPDYLPFSGSGLPQVNFDAPRLLAHAFLFEIDRFLDKRTGGHFLRWVDDITIAVHSVEEAKSILRDLDELLMTRGLRLNSGKTTILNPSEARRYLWQNENNFLTVFENRAKRLVNEGKSVKVEKIRLRKRFRKFEISAKVGHWDKVLKRYFTAFSIVRDSFLQGRFKKIIENTAEVRPSAFRYYSDLGPTHPRLEHIRDFLTGNHAIDDVSVFRAAQVLVEWRVGRKTKLASVIRNLGIVLGTQPYVERSPVYFIAALWMLGKYGDQNHLVKLIFSNERTWTVSAYLSRQVAGVSPRLMGHGKSLQKITQTFQNHGQMDAMNVMLNLRSLRREKKIDAALSSYVLHGSKPIRVYPLQKAIMAVTVLKSDHIKLTDRKILKAKLLNRIIDPVYLSWIQRIAL